MNETPKTPQKIKIQTTQAFPFSVPPKPRPKNKCKWVAEVRTSKLHDWQVRGKLIGWMFPKFQAPQGPEFHLWADNLLILYKIKINRSDFFVLIFADLTFNASFTFMLHFSY